MEYILRLAVWVSRLVFMMRTLAGKMLVVIIAGVGQVPGLAMYIQSMIMKKAGSESVSFTSYFLAMLYEGVVFALVITGKKMEANMFVFGAVFMNFSSWAIKYIDIERIIAQPMVTDFFDVSTVMILSATPAFVIKIFSDQIIEDIEKNMSEMSDVVTTVFTNMKDDMKEQVTKYFSKTKPLSVSYNANTSNRQGALERLRNKTA